VCLTGLPASGKSFFAKQLKSELEKYPNISSIKIVDPDVIRNSLGNKEFDPDQEKVVRSEHLQLIRKALKKGFIVISDDLNYYTSMRHDLKQIADEFAVAFFIIHISTPMEVCLKWNENRNTPIPNEVILEIERKFDKFGKYAWDVPFKTYDLSKITKLPSLTKELCANLLLESSPLINGVMSSKSTSKLDHEKIDQQTRIIVGDLLKKDDLQPFKQAIIKFRKKFLKNHLNTSLEDFEIKKEFNNQLIQELNLKLDEDQNKKAFKILEKKK